MLNHLFAVLTLASGLAHPLSAPAAPPATTLAASASLDPTPYLLDESELPAGFVHDPKEDLSGSEPGAALKTHWYEKSGEGFIHLVAYVNDSPEGAKRYYDELVQVQGRVQALEFTPIDDLGDEGTLGYAADAKTTRYAVFFRRGTMSGGVIWTALRPEQPREPVVMLARAMDARVALSQGRDAL